MTWRIKDVLKGFEYILKQSKEFYKLNAKLIGTEYHSTDDEVTSEELEMACLVISQLGNVKKFQ